MKRFIKLFLIALLLIPSIAGSTDYVTKTATPTGNFTFSIDVDLGSSDTTISSQNAVKSYTDAHFAPVNGYLLTTRDVPTLTNATNLGLLSTGLLKMTVSGGIAILSTAVDGTDYITANSQTANYFYAAPNGSAGVPTWRAIVVADLPGGGYGNVSNSGTPTNHQWPVWTTATAIKGVSVTASKPVCTDANAEPVACTNLTDVAYQANSATLTSLAGLTETNGGIPYGTGDNAYAWLAAGGSGKLLMGAGAAAPVWTTPTFPNAATTTGAYLRADGTNFIQSTLLLPNAGTAFTLAAYTAANTLTELAAVGGTGTILRGASGAIPAWSTSTFADTYVQGGLLHAATANTIAALAPGAVGSFLMSNGNAAALSYLAAGAANYQLVGAGVTTIPVWTASTGTGAPTLATSPAFTTDIHAATAGGATLGTAALPFSSIYLGAAATNNFQITGTTAAARIVNIPDIAATGYLDLLDATTTTAGKIPLSTTTAGKHTYSTPTYPSTSATARKMLVSDGTNWLASTELWPIATTSGNIMVADGTNWVTTAPTGTGSPVKATTPTLVTPILGVATATSINDVPTGWVQTVGTFTATPASTSTITMGTDLTATILVGYPLKYVIGGTTYYGIVTAIASNLLTVAGAPLGGDVTALYYGDPIRVTQMVIAIPSTYEDASNTGLVLSDINSNIIWQRAKSYLVKYTAWSKTHDSTTHGQASIRINGTEVNTTAGGLTIAADATLYSTVVDIATAAYDINNGEAIEVTAVKNGAGDATNLVMTLIFVTP